MLKRLGCSHWWHVNIALAKVGWILGSTLSLQQRVQVLFEMYKALFTQVVWNAFIACASGGTFLKMDCWLAVESRGLHTPHFIISNSLLGGSHSLPICLHLLQEPGQQDNTISVQ
jgi:hypothetical protein